MVIDYVIDSSKHFIEQINVWLPAGIVLFVHQILTHELIRLHVFLINELGSHYIDWSLAFTTLTIQSKL